MARQSELSELRAAWRALADEHHADGWRTIPIGSGSRSLRAGRHFPGNSEAMLVGFRDLSPASLERLPKGRGFVVARADLREPDSERTWIALARNSGANPQMFGAMADDLVSLLSAHPDSTDQNMFRLFVDRIGAWQAFMRLDRDQPLSSDSEVGLVGELMTLIDFVDSGVSAESSVTAWKGPLDGLQDFIFSGGALEVKSTLARGTFPARISSLEQLDESLVGRLFLRGIRLSLSEKGRTLPQIADDVRTALLPDPGAVMVFESRLIHAGYIAAHSAEYTRKFERYDDLVLQVDDRFPRLVHGNVPSPIARAVYEMNLDAITERTVTLGTALFEFGVIDGID